MLVMSQPYELKFTKVVGSYNALWDLSGQLVMNPKVGDHDNWLFLFRIGLRGMLARLTAVDREYVALHAFQSAFPADGNPNEYGLGCESHVGLVLFGMDSTIECLVFAMNAIGFARSPEDFRDIRDPKSLRQVNPYNILGNGKQKPIPGYQKFFPRATAHFTLNEALLFSICEYHDVSKHRSSVATGGAAGSTHLRADPKHTGTTSSRSDTLESLARDFQEFIDTALPIVLEEIAAVFQYSVTSKPVGA